MKNKLLLLFALILIGVSSKAQVGIGTANPDTNSILDLTNPTNGKYLVLPVATSDPTSLSNPFANPADSAKVIYYNGNLYMKTAGGIKVFTPWIWDGGTTSTHPISSPPGLPVGIGVAPAVSNYVLQLANPASGDITAGSGSRASILIGNTTTANHLELDNNEIMTKTSDINGGTLILQKDGGDVQIRSSAANAGTTTVLSAYGSIDAKGKIKENGNDLLPTGSIIMWAGSIASIPAGWVLCNGANGTPPLQDRFIAAAGSSYSVGATGGQNTHTLTASELPAHTHGGSTSTDGNHHHRWMHGQDSDDSGYGGGYNEFTLIGPTSTGYDNSSDGQQIIGDAGDHSHSIFTDGGNGLNSTPFENRPLYYALAYIMKL